MTLHSLARKPLESVFNEIGAIPDRIMNAAFVAERKPRAVTRQQWLEELAFYDQPEFRSHKRFFQLPNEAPAFTTLSCKPWHEGEALLMSYPSRYQTRNPAVQPRLEQHEENRTGYLWLWRHPSADTNAPQRPSAPQRPLVLCVHGFRMGKPARAKAMFKVEKLFKAGMDVALFIQPHHWLRSSSRYRQYFFNAEDIPLTIENVGQQIHDLHSCVLGLKALGYDRLGLIGGSLGGLAVTLYATVSEIPDFIFSVVPAIRFDTHLDPQRAKLPFQVDNTLREKTFQALDLIDPTFYSSKMDLSRFAVVYHQGDRINAAEATRVWAERWKVQNITSLPGGHWWVFDGQARGRAWYSWLTQHGYMKP
ncbi:Hypothetical protein HDN1F_12560 [gamma proteobacterium HdN1]|nr:Hypothetical protein HDN1F_12560 [gamma proteobacterium HdN1]